MSRRPRDSQRQAVYSWERRAGLWALKPESILTLKECQELVNRVWSSYMVRHTARGPYVPSIPQVTDGRGRRRACYAPDDHTVRFPKWSRQPGMVVHEVAHAIIEWRTDNLAWHGPEFVRVYCELLVAFLGHDPAKLIHELTTKTLDGTKIPRSVRIADTDALPWRKVAYAKASQRRAA